MIKFRVNETGWKNTISSFRMRLWWKQAKPSEEAMLSFVYIKSFLKNLMERGKTKHKFLLLEFSLLSSPFFYGRIVFMNCWGREWEGTQRHWTKWWEEWWWWCSLQSLVSLLYQRLRDIDLAFWPAGAGTGRYGWVAAALAKASKPAGTWGATARKSQHALY